MLTSPLSLRSLRSNTEPPVGMDEVSWKVSNIMVATLPTADATIPRLTHPLLNTPENVPRNYDGITHR